MEARMKNPAMIVPGAMEAIQGLIAVVEKTGLPSNIRALAHLRASQINGCSVCLLLGIRGAKKDGETDERLGTVAGWRDAPFFTPSERAALALTEHVTRMSDNSDAVPDAIWAEAAKHFDPPALGALILWIATTNLFNRVNAPTRQVAGSFS